MAVDATVILIHLRRNEHLKQNLDGTNSFEQFSTQADIFRLSGIIQGMLTFAGDEAWTELEAHNVVKEEVVEQLEETWKHLRKMKIPKTSLKLRIRSRTAPCTEFPRYLELPGQVVRKKILSYLTNPIDEICMAKAIPSEVQHLSGPLNSIQLKAVFPILMKKKLLEPIDIMNLSAADSYTHGFIRKHFETVLYKAYFTNAKNTMALEHVPVSQHFDILPLVEITNFNKATWNKLRSCGSKIFHCVLTMPYDMEEEQQLQWTKSYLELLPNLRTIVMSQGPPSEESSIPPTDPDLFPELPFLKNLDIWTYTDMLSLPITLLEMYGKQLELVHIDPFEVLQIPISWTCLSSLRFVCCDDHGNKNPSDILAAVVKFLNRIAECPLKVLNIDMFTFEDCPHKSFQQVLTIISNNWGETMERLGIRIQNLQINSEGFNWASNLGFPKLKQFEWRACYSFSRDWEFLLCCPVLEKLSFFQFDSYGELAEKPLIELYNRKERMLRSNVWKLFPKLDQVHFYEIIQNDNGIYRDSGEVCIARKDCQA